MASVGAKLHVGRFVSTFSKRFLSSGIRPGPAYVAVHRRGGESGVAKGEQEGREEARGFGEGCRVSKGEKRDVRLARGKEGRRVGKGRRRKQWKG